MNSTHNTDNVPVGKVLFGRILDHNCNPIDGMGPIEAMNSESTERADSGEMNRNRPAMFVTGIKPIDLMLPVPHGGVVSWTTPWMVGAAVLMFELMRTMKFIHGGSTVMVAVEGRPRELDDLRLTLRESGIHDSVTVILIPADAPARDRRNGVLAGLAIARNLIESEKRNALFVVDRLALTEEVVEMIRSFPNEGNVAMTTLVTSFAHDDNGDANDRFAADVQIVFDPNLAMRGLYPAIDLFRSESRMLQPGLIAAEHVRLAEASRELLRQLYDARLNASKSDRSSEEKNVLDRAARLERFLTQPFYVAQLYNAIPGEFVPPDTMLSEIAQLLEGNYDHLSEESLSYIGTVRGMLGKEVGGSIPE